MAQGYAFVAGWNGRGIEGECGSYTWNVPNSR